jgi:hypothetical protein
VAVLDTVDLEGNPLFWPRLHPFPLYPNVTHAIKFSS